MTCSSNINFNFLSLIIKKKEKTRIKGLRLFSRRAYSAPQHAPKPRSPLFNFLSHPPLPPVLSISTDNVVVSPRPRSFCNLRGENPRRWVPVTRERNDDAPFRRENDAAPWQSWPLRGVVDVDERNYHRCILIRHTTASPLSPITRRLLLLLL